MGWKRLIALCMAGLMGIVFPNMPLQASGVVQTSQQIYSYAEMQQDIAALSMEYPNIFSFSSLGLTGQGRNIYVICLGNQNASKHIMVQSSIHAREYMTSQLTMRMVEYVCDNYDSPSRAGMTYRELFDKVNFYIVPMANPDGVSIAQFGAAGAVRADTVLFVGGLMSRGVRLDQYKANANGVDINRNFAVGWGNARDLSIVPSSLGYPGACAQSEKETNALVSLAGEREYAAYLNYHSQGNELLYASSGCSEGTHWKSALMANVIQGVNGYRAVDQHWNIASGSFADYVQKTYDKPSVTVEIGTANPVPINQFSSIFQRNKDSWGMLAYTVVMGWL